MELEQEELVRAIANEPTLCSAVEACIDDVSFDVGQSIVKRRFEPLQCFGGGIESVFLGTSPMESYFSIVKAEKYIFRTAFTDHSLEGVLHCKQLSMLGAF